MKKLILIAALSFVSAGVSAQENCRQLFKFSNSVVTQLENKPVAMGLVKIRDKSIPVILANKISAPALRDVFSRSIGIVVAHQKGYKNDHGLFRIGDFFLDRDTPGYRQRGELYSTGISWVTVRGYVDYTYSNPRAYNRVEVLFDLTEPEFNKALIYQKMRRAALIRPKFSFGQDTNLKDGNNQLPECGEICFSFSTGSLTRQQVQAISNRIQGYGFKDVKNLMQDPEVQVFLAEAKKSILQADLINGELSPAMLAKIKVPSAVENLQLFDNEKVELLNWIASLEISEDYVSLLETLQIQNSSDYSNVTSSRASAVIVYDGNVTAEQFINSEYKSEGIFSTWKNTNIEIIQDGKIKASEKKGPQAIIPTNLVPATQKVYDGVLKFLNFIKNAA